MANGWRRCRATRSLSLYIHVPFCTELCFYCGCNTRAVRKREPVDAYAERLLEEIALLRGPGRAQAHPSALGRRHALDPRPGMAGDHRRASWPRASTCRRLKEHAIELDPRRIDRALVRALAAIGVNRASLGVQDVSPHVQQAIGRVQPFELVERAADWLREAGIDNLNIDLMYGLPQQTVRDVARSAELAASLAPQRLALFGYAHVPWFKTPSEADRRRRAARPGRAARAGAGRGRDAGEPRLRGGRPRPFRAA